MRLDKFLTENFGIKSRTHASQLIEQGKVSVCGKQIYKPSFDISELSKIENITVDAGEGYASQGGYKLAAAIEAFKINLTGKNCADIGCSNGGFTDVLLRNGANSVLAVDVGECALPNEILDCGKVTFLKANARNLPDSLPIVDFVCCDVSFISLKLILPSIYNLLAYGGESVTLVKPQFELRKSMLSKKGIVLGENDRISALNAVIETAEQLGFTVNGKIQSPARYADKNIEFLLYLKK